MARADNHQPAGALRTRPVLAIILASYTMIALDISIVITALPKIHTTLGFSNTALSWVQNAYLLAFGGLLLLGARAGDLVGRTPRNRTVRGTVRLAMATAGTLSTEGPSRTLEPASVP